MSDYLRKRGELVTTDSESFTLNDTKYRISVSVRFKDRYKIHVGLLKIRSTTPHDTIDAKDYTTRDKSEVQSLVEEGVNWAKQRAERQEDAKGLSVSVTVDSSNASNSEEST